LSNKTHELSRRKTIKSFCLSREDSSQFRQIPRLDYHNSLYSAKTRSGKFLSTVILTKICYISYDLIKAGSKEREKKRKKRNLANHT